MSRRVQLAIGAVLVVFLLWLFLREAELDRVVAELRRADYRWVALSTALTLAVTVHRAWRWHYLLLPVKSIGLPALTATTFMGWTFTTVLGGRIGEVARPVLLGRREGISKTAAFATVVLERLFDLLCVLIILVVYLLFFPLPSGLDEEGASVISAMRASGLAALAGLVVATAFVIGAQVMPRRTDAILVRTSGWLPGRLGEHLLPIGRSFLDGLAGMKNPRLVATIFIHSVLIWLNIVVTYWLLFFAFDIDLPFYAALPLVVAAVVGVLVPTPAAVGGFHAAALIALETLWGVPNEQAIGYAIICHAIVFIPITVIGLALLSREGLSMRGLRSELERGV